MPAHGKSKVQKAFGHIHTVGYVGTTTHRGTQVMNKEQVKLLNARGLPHTDWFRSEKGNLYGRRKP